MGSAIKRTLSGRSTQLDDFAEYKYNEKYKAWIPGNVDPDEWAKENLQAPPPPPTASMTPKAEEPSKDAIADGNATLPTPLPNAEPSSISQPHTPLPGLPQALSTSGRYSARGSSSRRAPARSRYVDTFNTGGDAQAKSDTDLMPPPPTRAKAAPPTHVFTPSKPSDDGERYQTPTQRVDGPDEQAND